jgi:hypothetical protein
MKRKGLLETDMKERILMKMRSRIEVPMRTILRENDLDV